MKTLITAFALATITFCACNSNDGKVYICTGPYSKAYHKTKNCQGLSNCSREIKSVTEEAARDMGRHKCGYCY